MSSSKQGQLSCEIVQLKHLESKSVRLTWVWLLVSFYLTHLTRMLGKVQFSGKGKCSLWEGFTGREKCGREDGCWRRAISLFKRGTENTECLLRADTSVSEFLALFKEEGLEKPDVGHCVMSMCLCVWTPWRQWRLSLGIHRPSSEREAGGGSGAAGTGQITSLSL